MTDRKILAVTFDMDGLMFNTEDLYDQVGEILLSRRNHSFTTELKLKMMGLPGPIAFGIMRDHLGLRDTTETLQSETDEIFHELLPTGIRTTPGLETILAALESSNIPKAVATSAHRNFAQQALGHFELEPRFEFILTADDVTRGKPHPEVYLTSARKLGVEPSQMLVLEDSLVGSTAAVAAGALTIAVPTRHSRHQDFNHVAHIANSLDDPIIMGLLG